MKPFLKWAGNKFQIIERIQGKLPEGKRLIEPFVGSAAVFLNTDFEEYLLADTNSDLIDLYSLLKKRQQKFIAYAESFFLPEYNQSEVFYNFREKFNKTKDVAERAALFIYLNRHGYNGLCRYNSAGLFNVPFGRYQKVYFPRLELEFFSKKAKKAEFIFQSFEQTMAVAKKGDVIYCDPPYVPLSKTANFTSYAPNSFNEAHQKELAEIAEKKSSQGIPVLISNHKTHLTMKLYQNSRHISSFTVQRFISSKGDKRKKAPELLALF